MIKVDAVPFEFSFEPASTALMVIDMQRDFVEPGGFGETLGNDVSLLTAIVPTVQAVLHAWREAGGLVRPYRIADADTVVLALGSVLGTIKDTIDGLRDEGAKIGALGIGCFRPWPTDAVRTAVRDRLGI